MSEETPPQPPAHGDTRTTPHAGENAGGTTYRDNTFTSAVLEPAPTEEIPPQIGPYRVVRAIGRGGMGTVILAVQEDHQFKRRVAIKLLRRGVDTADILRRFALERQVLAALNHPNIARLLDAGQTADGRPYFAMEYIEGRPIDDYCDAENLSVDDRLALFRKVCSAVHAAHQNLIVHRDLKPGNILVTAEGEPKLLDFGIAKLLNPDLLQVSVMTGPELRLMTPEYASPEQVQGQPIGIASDVYSLGVLLYELLSGHRPYRFATRMQAEIARVICDVDPEPPSHAVNRTEDVVRSNGTTLHLTPQSVSRTRGGGPHKLRRQLSGDLDNIIMRAMQKLPRRRYASAEQLAEDIQRHLDGLPVLARPDSRVYRLNKFIRRHRVGVSAAVLMALVLILGAGGTTWQWRVAVAERRAAEAARAAAQARAEQFAQLVDGFLTQLRGELRKVEGATAARKLLATTALDAAQQLQPDRVDDPAVALKLAEVSLLAGDVFGGSRTPNEGAPAEALECYENSLKVMQPLAERFPSDAALQRLLIRAQARGADALGRTGRRAEALKGFAAAVASATQLVGLPRARPEDQRLLAMALDGVGDQQLAMLNRAAAEEPYRAAQAARQRALEADPNDVDALRSASIGYNKLGKLLEDAGRLEESLQARRAALDLRLRVHSLKPDVRSRRDLNKAHRDTAEVLRQMGRLDEAQNEAEKALNLARELCASDPANARGVDDLCRSHMCLAGVQRTRGKFAEAAELCRTALESAEAALASGTPGPERYYLVAKAREGLARATHGTSANAALQVYAAALSAFDEELRFGPDASVAAEQAAVMAARGLALADAGQTQEAMAQIETALTRAAALGSEETLNAELRRELEDARQRLSELHSTP